VDTLRPLQCIELLREELVGHLAVISDGVPYVTPVSYVVSDSTLAMRVGEGRRVRAIRENPNAGFEVSRYNTETGDWTSVVVEGTVRIVEDDETIQTVIAGLLRKYRSVVSSLSGQSMPLLSDVVLEMRMEHVSGRSSGSFFSMRTRPGRL